VESSEHVLVLGSGHLAVQVALRLRQSHASAVHVPGERFSEAHPEASPGSGLTRGREILTQAGMSRARAVYILDSEDRINIQLTLIALSFNTDVPIFVALFHENLGFHLEATRANLCVRNPALFATPRFVEAARAPIERRPRYVSRPARLPAPPRLAEVRANLGLYALISGFAALLGLSWVFFHRAEKLSWLDAFYFTTRVMTTTDFGDLSLRQSSPGVKLFGILVMVSALTLISLTFSFLVDRLLKRRAEIALGRRRYRLRDHMIVCGLGRLGYQIVEELLRRGERVLVIEQNQENRFLEIVRSHGAWVFVADASLPRNLRDAGVEKSACLLSVVDDDLKNLEIALNARSLRPHLKLVLRIFDHEIAGEIRDRLDIHFALSSSAIAAEQFVCLAASPARAQAAPSRS